MADVRATKSGNWSDTTVWNTGALPTSADDVWANTFTVAADTTTTVLSIRNGSTTNVTAGGQFTAVNGVTLTLTGSGAVNGNASSTFASLLYTGQSCTIVGNALGALGPAINNASSGTVNFTGNSTGGTTSNTAYGVSNTSSGTINFTGNATGASGASNAHGAHNASTGVLNITGTCTGGGGGGAGANNAINGTLNHTGTVQASNTAAGISGANAAQVTILTGPFLTSANGVNPVTCTRWFWRNTTPPATYYQIRSANLSVIRPLYTADSVGGNPATSDVRSGTVYGPNSELTGTCAVPAAASVAFGVPVDNTTGTATISAADIRAAMGLASANLDTQLSAKPSAAAIRTEMDSNSTKLANLDATISSRSTYAGADTSGTTTLLSRLTSGRAGNLDNLDASVSSRLASSGYTTPPTVTQVRQEMDSNSTKLANLDTTVSSRLASSSYSAPPSAASIRAEIDSNSTKLDATVSSRLAASSYSAPLDAAGTRSAVGLNTNNLDTQLSNISSGISGLPSASAIASQVRTELATELSRLDAAISSRLATSGYTTPPTAAAIATAVNSALDRTNFSLTSAERTAIATAVEQSILNESDGQAILNAIVGAIGNTNIDQVALVAAIRADLERTGGTLATRLAAASYTAPPSAATNASAVRSEIGTELGRIDAAISSRLAPSGTLARVTLVDTTTTLTNAPDVPTESEIADAVRTELTPELSRISNAATTQEVGDIVEGAMQLPE